MLEEDCFLTELNLANNRIGEKDEASGAEHLARGLANNSSLTKLNLDHNQLSGPALLHIANAVATNATLEHVSLFHNNWDQPSARRFERIFTDASRLSPLRADFLPCLVEGVDQRRTHVEIAYNPQG